MNKVILLSFLLFGVVGNAYTDTLKAERIDKLYAEADFVGYVQVISGDFKEYSGVVYKAKILKVLKGDPTETEIYFGPFSGYGIGSEYLLFARKTDKTLERHWAQTDRPMIPSHYSATAQYFNIMFEGFGMMPIQYVVSLDGYGVEVATHIKLPPKLKNSVIRRESKDWVSKDVVGKYLESLGRNQPR